MVLSLTIVKKNPFESETVCVAPEDEVDWLCDVPYEKINNKNISLFNSNLLVEKFETIVVVVNRVEVMIVVVRVLVGFVMVVLVVVLVLMVVGIMVVCKSSFSVESI